MKINLLLSILAAFAFLPSCVNTQIVSLVGEEAEVARLLDQTKHTLNQRAALTGTTGPELLQSNSLPQADGQVIKVNYVAVFFGARLQKLKPVLTSQNKPDFRQLQAVSEKGDTRTLDFLRESDGWKLHPTIL